MGIIAERLTKWFTDDRVRDVIGNNPTIFEMAWEELDEKLRYLQYTMNVSAYRIAMTPKSLTHDLEFFRLRFEFLSRSGNYRHPDPGAKSAVPTEASPLLHLITDTEDERLALYQILDVPQFIFALIKSYTLTIQVYPQVLSWNDYGRI